MEEDDYDAFLDWQQQAVLWLSGLREGRSRGTDVILNSFSAKFGKPSHSRCQLDWGRHA